MMLKSRFRGGRQRGSGGEWVTTAEFTIWTFTFWEINSASWGKETKPTHKKQTKICFSYSMASEHKPSISYVSQLKNNHLVQCQEKLAVSATLDFTERRHSLKMIDPKHNQEWVWPHRVLQDGPTPTPPTTAWLHSHLEAGRGGHQGSAPGYLSQGHKDGWEPTVMTVSHVLSPGAKCEEAQVVLDLANRNVDSPGEFGCQINNK